MTVKIVLVGCGNMGFAMLSGWLTARKIANDEVFVVEPNDDLRGRAAKLGCQVAAGPQAIPGDANPKLVIFAVKPQVMREIVADYIGFATRKSAFLSIAAGTPIATFEEILGSDAAIVRCMPNTPAAIGKGMMVLFSNPQVTGDHPRFRRRPAIRQWGSRDHRR